MLSATLIQMIEDHAEQIAARVVRHIRKHPDLRESVRISDSELRDRAQDVLKRLGHWLTLNNEEEMARRYGELGSRRFHESVPLHELVHCFHILREHMVGFVREQGLSQSSVDLYAEEELEHRVAHFFDRLVYHVVRGYEEALRKAADLPA